MLFQFFALAHLVFLKSNKLIFGYASFKHWRVLHILALRPWHVSQTTLHQICRRAFIHAVTVGVLFKWVFREPFLSTSSSITRLICEVCRGGSSGSTLTYHTCERLTWAQLSNRTHRKWPRMNHWPQFAALLLMCAHARARLLLIVPWRSCAALITHCSIKGPEVFPTAPCLICWLTPPQVWILFGHLNKTMVTPLMHCLQDYFPPAEWSRHTGD